MWHTVKHYILFLLKSSNQHGVHSPFVFNLVTQCFYNKKKYPQYAILTQYREHLLKNELPITVTDFGSGSKKIKSNTRQINKLAKTAAATNKRTKLLFRLVAYFNPQYILELGTSLGIGTAALALGNSNNVVYTVEGCSNIAKIAQNTCSLFNIKNIQFNVNSFDTYLNQNSILKTKNNSWSLIYIDGNHTQEATLRYFNFFAERATPKTILLFDDIYWSKEMTNAWNNIKKDPRVTVTIDTFKWGFVFFRTVQPKQNFTIRM